MNNLYFHLASQVCLFSHVLCWSIFINPALAPVNSQICRNMSPYGRCSSNSACGCIPMAGASNVGVCAFMWTFCAELQPCGPSLHCPDRSHLCVHHSRCGDDPICYPVSMIDRSLCPSMQSSESDKYHQNKAFYPRAFSERLRRNL